MPQYVLRNGRRVARYSRAELDQADMESRQLTKVALLATLVGIPVSIVLHWSFVLPFLGALWAFTVLLAVAVGYYERQWAEDAQEV